MNLRLDYADYVNALRGLENKPASMSQLLSPFGILGAPSLEDEFLLVGHFLDAMQEAGYSHQGVVAADAIVELALDLGMSSIA
jgi:hypothetical protein